MKQVVAHRSLEAQAEATTILRTLPVFCPALSVTWTVNEKLPALVGVPLQTPLVENVRPGGLMPDIRDHEYGGEPPVALTVASYTAPTRPEGSELVAIVRGVAITIRRPLSTFLPALSVTWTVKEKLPAFVGVPLQTPLIEKARPGGLMPDIRDHE
jgi:hypothetical protein